jgi:hypothetical protein
VFAGFYIGVILLVMSLEFLRSASKGYDRYIVKQAQVKQQQQQPVHHVPNRIATLNPANPGSYYSLCPVVRMCRRSDQMSSNRSSELCFAWCSLRWRTLSCCWPCITTGILSLVSLLVHFWEASCSVGRLLVWGESSDSIFGSAC